MSRLPTIGGDSNAWGTVLNDFLSVAHNADGSLKHIYNIAQYGSVDPLGVGDSSTAITNAINAATAGGGVIFSPPGTYITGPQTLPPNVGLLGSGIDITVWKLKAGSNDHLLKGSVNGYGGTMVNIAATNASGSNGGVNNFFIRDMTFDGNKAAQTGGPSWCFQCYGQNFIVENVVFRNGYSGGWYQDWNGGTSTAIDNMDARVVNVKSLQNNGTGIKWGGPHDSRWVNVDSFRNAGNGYHIGPNAAGLLGSQCHPYGQNSGINAVGYLIETTGCQFSNCASEGSDVMQVVFLANQCQWTGGHVFDPNGTASGIQLGQAAGNTPYFESTFQSAGVTTAVAVTDCVVQALATSCNGGAINFGNSSGNNRIDLLCDQASGNYITGTINNQDTIRLQGKGLTPDGSIGKSGTTMWALSSGTALGIRDASNLAVLNVNSLSTSRELSLSNGTVLKMYSDGFTTRTVMLNAGTMFAQESATAAAIANNGTITTQGVGIARIAPTANVTGIIMQAASASGQFITVINESAFTVTMDVAATSRVADGTSCVILANRAADFKWDNAVSRWYRV